MINITYRKHARFILVLLSLLCTRPSVGIAQELSFTQQNFSNVKVDNISDQQIKNLLQQVKKEGRNPNEIEHIVAERGMPPEEVAKLKERIATLEMNSSNWEQMADVKTKEFLIHEDNAADTANDSLHQDQNLADGKLPVFGAAYFTNLRSNFAPNANRPTPMNYILGPGDELAINVYGNSVVNWTETVSPEGYMMLSGMGKVYVGGKTIENATEMIRARLRANNYAIGKGTDVSISLTNIRSIRVNINGEVRRPGPYTVSSLSTVLNALYESGGPNEIGSLRSIELYRNNSLHQRIDLYDYILRGDKSADVLLEDDDIINVPPYRVRVSLDGEVKRPAFYEVMPGESLKDVLLFAGGFTEKAYTAQIKAEQLTDRQKRVRDVPAEQFDQFVPLKGDQYVVTPILERYENRVILEGAVFRPGQYELEAGLTLSELIKRADGLKEDAFLQRGYITRLKADNTTETVAFNVGETAAGTAPAIPLHREDVIRISSIFDLRESYSVSIRGMVRNEGVFAFSEGMTAEDLIIRAGGLNENANVKRATISRRVKNSDRKAADTKLSEIIDFDLSKDLSKGLARQLVLQPFDVVTIYREPGYESPRTAVIEGEIMLPGEFTIKVKNEKISDLVKRAGGFTSSAYLEGASLRRADVAETNSDRAKSRLKLKQFERGQNRITGEGADSLDANLDDEAVRNNYVGIDLAYIMKHPGSYKDLILENGDVLNVPKRLQTVKISGEVLSPVTTMYEPMKGLRSYVTASGGFTEDAIRRKSYVVYANGSVKGTHSFLGLKNYPRIEPGSEIFIPKRKPKLSRGDGRGLQLVLGISTSAASLAAIVFGIISTQNK